MKKEIKIADEFFSGASGSGNAQPRETRAKSESEAMRVILGTTPKRTKREGVSRAPKSPVETPPQSQSSMLARVMTRAVFFPFVLARSAMDCWASVIRNTLDE